MPLPFVDDDPLFWGCMAFLCSVSFDSLSDAQKRSICTDETYENENERENVFKVLDNKVDLLFTQVSSVLSKVDYIVDIGSACIPVGKSLTEQTVKEYYNIANNLFSNALFRLHNFVKLEEFCTLAASFDGEVLHSYTNLVEVFQSSFTAVNIQWQLKNAGYKVEFGNDMLGGGKKKKKKQRKRMMSRLGDACVLPWGWGHT